MKRLALLACLALPLCATAQWKDLKKLGQGGEAFVATDGKGSIYVTSHQPSQLLTSRDWGASFGVHKLFPDSMCDLHVTANGSGMVNLIYIRNGVTGLVPWVSKDGLQTFEQGNVLEGPFDREWLAVDPRTNAVHVAYSEGYIGGPASTGVYLASSKDGKTFSRTSRVDNEPANAYPVDPYLAIGSGGRLYGMWGTTTDRNTIARFGFSSSNDGGKSWSNHQVVTQLDPALGDTQERWMLGCLLAVGADTVYAFYPNYASVDVDGKPAKALLVNYKVSTDGGKTFSSGRPTLNDGEIQEAIRSFRKGQKAGAAFDYYIQTLPWACTSPSGRVFLAFQDNRSGQRDVGGAMLNVWHVRWAELADNAKGCDPSERVSYDVACFRPPLDFLACAADSKYGYVIWTETPDLNAGWVFTGDLMFGRRILGKRNL